MPQPNRDPAPPAAAPAQATAAREHALVLENRARLTVTPQPDSVLRVFMAWKGLEKEVDIPPQELPAFQRQGFALVEWGGAEVSH